MITLILNTLIAFSGIFSKIVFFVFDFLEKKGKISAEQAKQYREDLQAHWSASDKSVEGHDDVNSQIDELTKWAEEQDKLPEVKK
jgi:polyhydroxyalkanoate synthesis regulator phasin